MADEQSAPAPSLDDEADTRNVAILLEIISQILLIPNIEEEVPNGYINRWGARQKTSFWSKRVREKIRQDDLKAKIDAVFDGLNETQIQTVIESYFTREEKDKETLGQIDAELQQKLYRLFYFERHGKYPNQVFVHELKRARKERKRQNRIARKNTPKQDPVTTKLKIHDPALIGPMGLYAAAGTPVAARHVRPSIIIFSQPRAKPAIDSRLAEILDHCLRLQAEPLTNPGPDLDSYAVDRGFAEIGTYLQDKDTISALVALREEIGDREFRRQVKAHPSCRLVKPILQKILPWSVKQLCEDITQSVKKIRDSHLPEKDSFHRSKAQNSIFMILKRGIDPKLIKDLLYFTSNPEMLGKLHSGLHAAFGRDRANLVMHFLRIALFGKSKKTIRREKRLAAEKTASMGDTAKPQKIVAAPAAPEPNASPPTNKPEKKQKPVRTQPEFTFDKARELLEYHRFGFHSQIAGKPLIQELVKELVELSQEFLIGRTIPAHVAEQRRILLHRFQEATHLIGIMGTYTWRRIQNTGVGLETIGLMPADPYYIAFWVKHHSETIPNWLNLDPNDILNFPPPAKPPRRRRKKHRNAVNDPSKFWNPVEISSEETECLEPIGPDIVVQVHADHATDCTVNGTTRFNGGVNYVGHEDHRDFLSALDASISLTPPKNIKIRPGSASISAMNRVKSARLKAAERADASISAQLAEKPSHPYPELDPEELRDREIRARLLAAHAAKQNGKA